MKTSSIKRSLPRLAQVTILLLIALILPANLWVQLYAQHQSQRESSAELFFQLKQLIENNTQELEEDKRDFSERCIRAADIAAYCVERRPEITENPEAARELADRLDVDEIHCLTPEGVVYGGTHPEYYGYSFESGEQMRYFLPMLEDRDMKFCQEITPNTAEGKLMQYAAVWEEDGSGIIEIGMEPKRIIEAMKENSLEAMMAEIPLDPMGYLYAVDLGTEQITASTDPRMVGADISEQLKNKSREGLRESTHYCIGGKRYCVYTEQHGDIALVRCYPSDYLLRGTLLSTGMVFIYLILTAVVAIGGITWYMDKKLARNLVAIVNEMKRVQKGDFSEIEVETSVKEFDELIYYTNQMLKSIQLGWDKLTRIINKGRIPIGIFEHNRFFGKAFINSRLLELLGMEESEEGDFGPASDVENRLEGAMGCPADEEEQIYEYDRDGEIIYLKIEKQTDEQSVTYYVSDMSQWWKEINELREQSSRDSLTRLYNRRGFNNRLQELFARPDCLGFGVVIMMDADGLKRINDMYGHSVGDDYLRRIGAIIEDTAGTSSVCARLGGDEFIIFLYGFESEKDIEKVCRELKARRGEQFVSGGITEFVEFSIGCAVYPSDGTNYHTLMYTADERMYLEKKERKAIYMGGGIRRRKDGKIGSK